MTRTSLCVLVLALALSACGNDAGGDDSKGDARNAAAVEGTGSGSADLQAGGSATSSQSTPVPPSAAQPGGAATMPFGVPLGPLLEEDLHSEDRMGCTCMFSGREGLYLSALDGELMVRTPAGLQLCPITDPQLQSLGEPGGEVSCAGVRMSIRETGERVTSIEADSSSAPAILSATQDGITRTLNGDWGCAC